MAKVIIKYALTGGASNALDFVDGADLAANDVAFVWYNSLMYHYVLDESGLSESSPAVITPDTNAGSKRWRLQGSYANNAITATTRAATTALGSSLNHTLSDTSANITAFTGVAGMIYHCRALGAGNIVHHATNLIITQTGATIATATGDTFDVEMITATTCRIKNYQRVGGIALTGTFTPGIAFGGLTTGITYGTVACTYWKLGKMVIVNGTINLTNKGSASGNATITGLPFTNSASISAANLWLSAVTYSGAPQGYVTPSNTTITLGALSEAGSAGSLDNMNFSNTSAIVLNASYEAAS